jgi:integrase
MKKKTFAILFYVKRTKLLKNGEAPIFMRITVDALRAEMSIQRSINLSEWDEKKCRAKPTNAKNRDLNHYLDSIRYRLYKIQKELEDENKTVTAELLKNRYMGINEANVSFVKLYTEHNQKMKESIGKGNEASTLKRHEISMNHVIKFLQYKYSRNDILLKEITPEFIREYEHYMRTVKNCAKNTTNKYIRNMGKILNEAEQKGIIKKSPLSGLKFHNQEIEKVFLTDTELDAVLKKTFVTDRLTHIRDVFVFCCFTGLAFVDVKQLRREDLTVDSTGEIVIRKKRQKSGVPQHVPLLQIARQILDKYKDFPLPNGQVLPVPTNQKMNEYLKEIADVCGITKTLTTHVARHTFATTVTLANNVPIEVVSKMLGHKSIKMTQHYAKVLEKTVVREMGVLASKLNYTAI